MLHHLLNCRRVLRTVLRPLLGCGRRGLRLGLCRRCLSEGLVRLNGLLGHLGVLRVGVRLLVRLLVGLLVWLLVRLSLRIRLVRLLSLRWDIRLLLLHLAEVELVRVLSLRWYLCLCHWLLESRCSLRLGCVARELDTLWLLLLLLLLRLAVGEVATTLALSVTSATTSFATSASSSTASIVPATTAAAISIATLLWCAAHLLHLCHVVWALERSVHAIVVRIRLCLVVVVEDRWEGVLRLVVGSA